MKKIQITICILLASFFTMSSAQAHDASKHAAKMEKPKCEAMQSMDQSTMDKNDPVMMAMMKKCSSEEPTKNHHTEGAVKDLSDDSDKKQVDKHRSGDNH